MKHTIIGSDNGLSPYLTNARIQLNEHMGTNIMEYLIENRIFAITRIRLNMASGRW